MIAIDKVKAQRSLPGQRLALPPVLHGELGAVVPAVEAVVPPQGDQVIAVEIKINAQLITFIKYCYSYLVKRGRTLEGRSGLLLCCRRMMVRFGPMAFTVERENKVQWCSKE